MDVRTDLFTGAALNLPIGVSGEAGDLLGRAADSYRSAQEEIQPLVAGKLEVLQCYDVPNMNRAAAICHWGRSGSFLLASNLDNHPDILMMPMLLSTAIYPFFRDFSFLSVWEKLIAYPMYSAAKMPFRYGDFFLRDNPEGDGAVATADYYAAVHALFEIYGDRPPEWLDARLRFFQFQYAAYAAATGRRLENPRPLLIHAQHHVTEELSKFFIEDFPDGKFVHTVRDPITAVDSWFDIHFLAKKASHGGRPDLATYHLDAAVGSISELLSWDRGNPGMEARTRAIRFEDLHLAPEATMRRLADWLGVPYRPCLLASTWNGKPYVVKIRGISWCGSNPANAQRHSKNLDPADRLMIFSLLHDNFITWNYSIPSPVSRRWIRLCAVALCLLLPMKIELTNAIAVLRLQVLPNLRRGRRGFACRAPIYLLKRRLRMMWLIASQARVRLVNNGPLLKLL